MYWYDCTDMCLDCSAVLWKAVDWSWQQAREPLRASHQLQACNCLAELSNKEIQPLCMYLWIRNEALSNSSKIFIQQLSNDKIKVKNIFQIKVLYKQQFQLFLQRSRKIQKALHYSMLHIFRTWINIKRNLVFTFIKVLP